MNLTQLFIGFGISFMVALIAYKKSKLTRSGFYSALLLGTIVYGFGSWIFYVLLMVFFISSLLIQRLILMFTPDHPNLQKHSARNWIQVLANGGVLGVISLVYSLYPTDLVVFAAALSMAASTSDTWASEIGSLSKEVPFELISRKKITKGLSGGVTKLGLLASFLGSALISQIYLNMMTGVGSTPPNVILWVLLCCLGGFMGSLIDSVLGELFQAKYIDEHLEVVETKHNQKEKLIHGYAWLDNNMVNLLSNLIVVILFVILIKMLGWN